MAFYLSDPFNSVSRAFLCVWLLNRMRAYIGEYPIVAIAAWPHSYMVKPELITEFACGGFTDLMSWGLTEFI